MTMRVGAGMVALALAGCASQTAGPPPMLQQPVIVFAAGSLRAALNDLAGAYGRDSGTPVQLTFGASGLLKDRLTAGEVAHVFASANMEHPQALVASGVARRVEPFATNALCALASPTFALNGKPLAQRLLDADVKLGSSTPKADPSGDYAFRMFELVESTGAAGAGSAAALKARALQLTGGPNSPPPPAGRNVYGALVASGQADVFITYCTNATVAMREQPQLKILPLPPQLNVSARYGVALLRSAGAPAEGFVQFMLAPKGQAILASHGFSAP